MEEKYILQLPRVGLFVDGRDLIKKDREGNISTRVSLSQIREAKLMTVFDHIGGVIVAIGVLAVYFAHREIGNEILKWIVMICGGVLGIFGLFGIQKNMILIDVNETMLQYEILSSENEDARGFVLSLNSLVQKRI